MDNIVIIKSRLDYNENTYDLPIFPKNNKSNNIFSYSIGLLFVDKDDAYVLTCYHGIKNTYNQEIFINKKNLDLTNLKLKLYTYNLNTFIKKKILKNEIINCTFDNIIYDNLTSKNIPCLPYINLKLNKNFNDISELKGFSGSILKTDNE